MSSDHREHIGEIIRVNGPIVEARQMEHAGMLEVVEVGAMRLIGEVIKVHRGAATIQVYENTSGLHPGEKVFCTSRPLSVRLGPGLLGTIYDGIQRPLDRIAAISGAMINRGEKAEPLDVARLWRFQPLCKPGDRVTSGTLFGEVQETLSINHRLLTPPDVSGTIVSIVPEGDYAGEHPLAIVKLDKGGERPLTMFQHWPVRLPRPVRQRLSLRQPLLTGLRVIDAFFPIAKGGAAAIPGGFGTGKTMTQQALAKWSDAHIIVYIGCGERGNEMTEVLREFPELVDPRSGRSLMERTILIANTSNMPVAAREVSIYTGITLAEYYRDMGYDVAVMADSTSRWAEALRELSGRLEEMPADEGFPAYLPARLAGFYERAGKVETMEGKEGSVSVIGAVSPPGGDFSEPVTQHTSRFIRCFWALDRDLANARHYPAISWKNSYSEYLVDITDWWKNQDLDWPTNRQVIMEILQEETALQQIAKLIGPDALPDGQRLTLLIAEIIKNAFLQQNSFDEVDMYCSPGKQSWMMAMLVKFTLRSRDIIHRGGALADIQKLPGLDRFLRMKSEIQNGDTQAMAALEQLLSNGLDALERKFVE
ncbi:MAG: V-type ATP synthase subunit A [Lentisphaerae bacterium]|nr:V-type ATP synthase subunit A [Lentisphaerota bacterium]HQL88046.1 V-type ATP synthase subunit A [Lentisphaeria bacterium]